MLYACTVEVGGYNLQKELALHAMFMYLQKQPDALAFQSGGALYEGLCKAFAAGCSYDQPFKLLLYSDEIVPGNP